MLEDIPGQLFIAIGVVIAALIAGFFSFLNLATSKEQKVSEFRQAWIDELRQEVSKHTSALNFLAISYSAYKDKNKEEKDILKFYESVRESYEQVVHTYTSISLRLNTNEVLNKEFAKTLNEIRHLFNEGKFEDARICCNSLREKSMPILKEEWERVKKGEPTYRKSKVIALIIFVLGLLGSGVSVYFIASDYYAGKRAVNSEPQQQEKAEEPANK